MSIFTSLLGDVCSIYSTTPTSAGPPKRMSDENVYRSSTGSPSSDSSRPGNFVGRSLSNEKFPRSGSWNSHMRVTSPVLPSKYVAASDRQRLVAVEKGRQNRGLKQRKSNVGISIKLACLKKKASGMKLHPHSHAHVIYCDETPCQTFSGPE